MKIQKLALTALLTSLALVLSYVERLIPLQLVLPLPGVKLGLGNIVTLTALYFIGPGEAFAVTLLRCLLGTVFSGSITGLWMSLAGGVLSLSVMWAAKKLPFLSVYGVSILGAAAHNTGQIIAAALVLYSGAAFGYLPFLLLTALATGTVTGAVAAAAFRPMKYVIRYGAGGAGK